jgi:ankyrin repeat protein
MRISAVIFGLLLFISGWSCQNRHTGTERTQPEASTFPARNFQDQGIPAGISLHEAALAGNTEWTATLVNRTRHVDTLDGEGHTPLMLAAFNGHTGIAALLLDKGADVNRKDPQKLTPLHFAASGPFPEMVKMLLQRGADINSAVNDDRFTPLMYAAAEGHLEVVKILVAHGADTTVKDKDGDTAESFARKNNHTEVAGFLQKQK